MEGKELDQVVQSILSAMKKKTPTLSEKFLADAKDQLLSDNRARIDSAKEFGITKATVSDAVRSLLGKKLLKKQSAGDARAFSLYLTTSGHKQVEKLGALTQYFDEALTAIPASERKKIWEGLLLLIGHLQKTGVIPLRMCFNCQHFSERKGAPYCNLLQQSLYLEDIRLDCPEHLLAA